MTMAKHQPLRHPAAPARIAAAELSGLLSFTALVFDVDGTIADTEEMHRQAFNEAFRRHNMPWQWTPERYSQLLQVTGGKERIGACIDSLNLPESERANLRARIAQVHGAKTRFYHEAVHRGGFRVRPGVERLMAQARAAGVRLGIASTTSPSNVESLLRASFGPNSLHWFSAIATGDMVARKKPAPEIYRLVLDRLGIGPERAIAVEDSAIGLRSAKAAGLFTVVTPSSWTREQDFSAADLVLPSLGDPQEPLPAGDARRIGGPMLGLEQLAVLHSAASRDHVSSP